MNKKLEDMTLAEVKSYCANTACSKCSFHDDAIVTDVNVYGCGLRVTPDGWVFKDIKRKLCDEDLELLKAIHKLFPFAQGIYAANDISSAYAGTLKNGKEVVYVSCCLFSHDVEDCSITWFKDVEGMEDSDK